jgi:hypothetical protein
MLIEPKHFGSGYNPEPAKKRLSFDSAQDDVTLSEVEV